MIKVNSRRLGTKKPRKTKTNTQIKKAVKKAVNVYKEAYKRLAYE